MENEHVLNTVRDQDCGCCQVDGGEVVEGYGCHERSVIFTPREQTVLAKIREARERAAIVKKDIERLSSDGRPDLREKAIRELDGLRTLRAELEEERIAAAEERMRLLGHA